MSHPQPPSGGPSFGPPPSSGPGPWRPGGGYPGQPDAPRVGPPVYPGPGDYVPQPGQPGGYPEHTGYPPPPPSGYPPHGGHPPAHGFHAPRKRSGRLPILLGVIALALLIAGIGGAAVVLKLGPFGPTADEERLLAMVPAAIRGSCTTADVSESSSIVARVRCRLPNGTSATYELGRSQADLERTYITTIEELEGAGDRAPECGRFGRGGRYAQDATEAGTYYCGTLGTGSLALARVTWNDAQLGVFASASRQGFEWDQLYDFWTTAGPERQPGAVNSVLP